MTRPRLILFAGRPGVGKTTLARMTAKHLGAVFLRIDTIEDGLRQSHLDISDLRDAGYTTAQALASDALGMGQTVVADAVHGHAQGRADWNDLAAKFGIQPIWFTVICSDPTTHKSRIDARKAARAKHGADWSEVSSRQLDPVPADWPTIDTAHAQPAESFSEILAVLTGSAAPD